MENSQNFSLRKRILPKYGQSNLANVFGLMLVLILVFYTEIITIGFLFIQWHLPLIEKMTRESIQKRTSSYAVDLPILEDAFTHSTK